MPMIYVSLLLNILVLLPICLGMLRNATWVAETWGEKTDARAILFSIYFAILAVSTFLLFLPDSKLVAALLLVQIVYKITTPFTVGKWGHPVVVSNLLISAVHLVTLISIAVGSA